MAVNVGQRHVPDTPGTKSLYAIDKARDLAVHTIKICKNENIFLPEYKGAITEDLIKTAKDIFCDTWAANNIKVDNSPEKWKQRKYLQERSAAGCNRMLAMIGLAKTLFHLRGKKVQYWSQFVVDTRGLIRKWQESDIKRYGSL